MSAIQPNKAAIANAFRRAVKARLEMWNAMDEIETLADCDIDMDELIANFAISARSPEEAMDIDECLIITALECERSSI